MHQTGRGVLGNKAASGTEIIQELGEEHQKTGKWIVYTSADSVFQIAAHEETIPLEELYEACRVAREILTGKHAVGRVIARPFTGEPGNYTRTPNRHDFSLEPRSAELPDARCATRASRCTASARSATSSPASDIDESHPTKSNVEGITRDEQPPAGARRRPRLRRTSSRPTCSGATATTRSTSTAACRTSTGGCPTSSTRCGRATCSSSRRTTAATRRRRRTDHSREHALLLAYVEGRNADGHVHEEGEFADVGATVNAWLGGKSPGRGIPGRSIVRRGDPSRPSSSSASATAASSTPTRSRSWCSATRATRFPTTRWPPSAWRSSSAG